MLKAGCEVLVRLFIPPNTFQIATCLALVASAERQTFSLIT